MALKERYQEFVEVVIANPMATNLELGEIMGVSRNTIHDWKLNPEIKAEIKSRLREKWEDAEGMAMETMQKLARKGDYKAAKYILDSLDYAPVQKVEAELHTDININVEE